MITPELRTELENHKPKNYVKKVLARLEELGETNTKNKPYDPVSVRSVYGALEYRKGKFRENKIIEAAIIYVFKKQKQANQQKEIDVKKLTEDFK